MFRLSALILFATLLFTGCATQYQPEAYSGGYTETWLSDRVAFVDFSGNGYTSAERARNYAAYRTCELALQNGYTHFILLERDASSTEQTLQVAPDRTTIRPDGLGGLTATTRDGQDVTVFKPSTEMKVLFLHRSEIRQAREMGYRPVEATFFLRKNAPADIRAEILGSAEANSSP